MGEGRKEEGRKDGRNEGRNGVMMQCSEGEKET